MITLDPRRGVPGCSALVDGPHDSRDVQGRLINAAFVVVFVDAREERRASPLTQESHNVCQTAHDGCLNNFILINSSFNHIQELLV